ncbi:hypothetical protein R3P38DRAFT_1699812 [Favolaschia claudopus]|uniref:Uncharacterized protein n=1 Tax=Favolaschia claudopus TaxID=2862362 RepID=A0AAW0ADC2_9AGAR
MSRAQVTLPPSTSSFNSRRFDFPFTTLLRVFYAAIHVGLGLGFCGPLSTHHPFPTRLRHLRLIETQPTIARHLVQHPPVPLLPDFRRRRAQARRCRGHVISQNDPPLVSLGAFTFPPSSNQQTPHVPGSNSGHNRGTALCVSVVLSSIHTYAHVSRDSHQRAQALSFPVASPLPFSSLQNSVSSVVNQYQQPSHYCRQFSTPV